MDLFDKLEVLSAKYLGEDYWKQHKPRDVLNALLAMAFAQGWDRDGDAGFLTRAYFALGPEPPPDYDPAKS